MRTYVKIPTTALYAFALEGASVALDGVGTSTGLSRRSQNHPKTGMISGGVETG